MTFQSKINIWDSILPDFNHMLTNNTIAGALKDFGFLLKNLQIIPSVKEVIIKAENQIAEEKKTAFEKFEKAVESIQQKIRSLLCLTSWEEDSWQMIRINDLLTFKVISLSSRGYLSDLLFELRRVGFEILQNQLGQPNEFCYFDFDLPIFLTKEIEKPLLQDQIYEWKEKADTSLFVLYRFLKILTLEDSPSHLTLSTNPSSWIPPKNLQELKDREDHIQAGYYLSLFKSSDIKKHPFNIEELCRLVKRFIFFLEREIANIDVSDQTESSISHWRTRNRDADIQALIPFAKDGWNKELTIKPPEKLSREKMAYYILDKLSANISLHSKDKERLPRILEALKITDPRIFKNGKFLGLKPHWKNFEWVEV